ncbi:MAG TPA: MBL fold metallo-hydrolase, partial [Gammaproteobacteria bacterium]
NKGWNSNAIFVVTKSGVLVFDTGSSETIGKALLKTIRKVTDKPVRWVINSHGHGDHFLGNAAFAGKGVEIISSEQVKARIATEGYEWVSRFNTMTEGATGESQVVTPAIAVSKENRRNFGGVEVQVLFSGDAHSPGDIMFWLPGKNVLLTGDVMYTGRAPATFDANAQHWIAALERLHKMQPKVVVPGHGPVGDAQSIADLHDYLSTLWTLVIEGYDVGQADFEMLPAIRDKMARFETKFPGFNERLGESVSHLYLQVEAAAFK